MSWLARELAEPLAPTGSPSRTRARSRSRRRSSRAREQLDGELGRLPRGAARRADANRSHDPTVPDRLQCRPIGVLPFSTWPRHRPASICSSSTSTSGSPTSGARRGRCPEWNLEVVAAFMRAAYGKGYCDALTEDEPGSLCHDHGYRIPARRETAPRSVVSGATIQAVARKRNPARLVIALSVAAVLAVFLLYTSIAGGGTPSVAPSELAGQEGRRLARRARFSPATRATAYGERPSLPAPRHQGRLDEDGHGRLHGLGPRTSSAPAARSRSRASCATASSSRSRTRS